MQGILGLIHLVLVIWALVTIWKGRGTTGNKALWTVVVIVFPLVGLLVWYFVGKK